MKLLNTLAATVLCLVMLQANAQNGTSSLKKATLVLADGTRVTGQIKDNIRKNASVTLTPGDGGKKKNYHGSDLVSAEIEDVKYTCINGDFFKVISEGELSFFQKSSDASAKPTYNGNEAIFSSGTEGKPGDYFIYHVKNKQLKLVAAKNFDEVTAASFAACPAAIDKAKTANGEPARLQEAVEAYNNCK